MSPLGKSSLVVAALGSGGDRSKLRAARRECRLKGGEWGDQRLVSLSQETTHEVVEVLVKVVLIKTPEKLWA